MFDSLALFLGFAIVIIPAIAAYRVAEFSVIFVVCSMVLAFGLLIVADRGSSDISWTLTLGLFVSLVIWIGLWWFAGRIGADINELMEEGNATSQQLRWGAKRAAVYTIPAILIIWISFDAAELYERRVMYGCQATEPSSLSYYGTEAEDDIFHGLVDGDSYFVSARTSSKTLFKWSPEFPDGPLIYALNWTGWACPDLNEPLDHEKSALDTVSVVASNMRAGLEEEITKAIDEASENTEAAVQNTEHELFGDLGHACHARDQSVLTTKRGVLPGDGECVFGKLPGSCGFWRWVSRTGECVERKVKKPSIQTYESWRGGFFGRFQMKAAEIMEDKNRSTKQLKRELQQFVDVEINNYEQLAKTKIRWSFLGWAIIGWIGIISAISFVTKIFLTLFGRFVFSDEGLRSPSTAPPAKLMLIDRERREKLVPITDDQVKPARCKSKSDGSGFRLVELDLSAEDRKWQVFDNAGVTWPKYGHVTIFYRLQDAYMRRLRSGKATVHHLEGIDDNSTGVGRVRQDLEIIEICLDLRQEVVVDMTKLLAFEDSIRFKTVFLPRLGAFFQRQLFYPIAKCKGRSGRIYMIGEGKAFGRIVANEPDGFVDPQSVGFMDLCGSYGGAASLRYLSPYYRPVTLGPAETKTIMFASNTQSIAAVGLLARLRGLVWFLLPM